MWRLNLESAGQVPGKLLERNDMADSSETARWYVAELVEELILDANVRNVIHRKTRVIFADSEEDAYEKALSLSSEHEITYLNQTHKSAQTRYWSLNELNLLQEEQSHPPQPKKRVAPHYRRSDQLTPVQVALLMSMQRHALPN
jgi:site-specific DNA-cytosine methylase